MPKRKSSVQSESDQKKAKLEATSAASGDPETESESLLVKTQSLLTDIRNDRAVKCIVNKIESNIKESNKKGDSNEMSQLFKSLLSILVEKSFSEFNGFERLLTCINHFKIETLNEIELCDCLNLVSQQMRKTGQPIENKIETIISNICRHLATTKSVYKVIDIFNELTKDYKSNHSILVQLLGIFNGARLVQHKQIAVSIIRELLPVRINKVKLSHDIIERLIFNLLESCAIYSLDDQYAFVYEHILAIVLEKRKKIEEKLTSIKLESSIIQMIVNHLSATKNSTTSQEYLVAFKSVLNKSLTENEILDKFILCLYFSTFNQLKSKALCEQYNDYFAEYVKNLLDISNQIRNSAWLKNCTYKEYNSFHLINVFNSRLVCQLITPDTLTNGIFNLSKCLLNKTTENSDSMCNFMNQIIEGLFSTQLTNKPKLIEDFLNLCFKSSHRAFYINLLKKLLDKESIRKALSEQLNEIEKARVQITLVNKLTSSSSHESVLFLESTNDAVNLINALQPLIFELKIEHIKELVDYFETNLKNVSTEKASAYCMISLIKALNTKTNLRSPKDEIKMEQHYQYSIRLLEQFKEILRKSIDSDLKSQIYQSFYFLIKSNAKLSQPISALLLKQIKKYTIMPKLEKSKYVYLDMGKCFVMNQSIQLIEPLDVLFHSICVCVDRMCKQQSSQLSSQKNMSELKSLVDLITAAYTENAKTSQIDSLYNKQIASVLNQPQSAHLFKMTHQIKLGLIDSLIEYSTLTYSFVDIPKLVECYDSTYNSNSLDLENLVSGKLVNTTSAAKRKLFNGNHSNAENQPATSKKLRLNEENKENKQNLKTSQRGKATKREPLAEITNEPSVKPSTSHQAPQTSENKKPSLSSANIQLDNYEPRMSFEAILKLISLTQITTTNQYLIDIKLTRDAQIRSQLINLITNAAFNEYVIRIVESKLRNICENKSNKSLYDIHSTEQKELFEMLAVIWNNYYGRIIMPSNNSKSDKFSFKPALPVQFNQNFLVKFHRCLNICVDIWKIVNKYFSHFLINLVSFKNKPIYSNEHQELAWQFLIDCTNKIELLIKSTEASSLTISKCCSILLRMISDILDKIDLSTDKINNLYAWLCKLAKKSISGEKEIINAILSLFMQISGRKFSSTVIVKHLLLEYHNYIATKNTPGDALDQIEYGIEFKLLNEHSLSDYYKCVLDELTVCLNQIKWAIKLNNYFQQFKLVNLVTINLESVILAVNFLIQSTTDSNSANFALNLLDQFYQFMLYFLTSEFLERFDQSEIQTFKRLIELAYTTLEANIEEKLNNIHESLWARESNEAQFSDKDQLTRFLNYKQMINSITASINQFEQKSCDLFAKYKNNNIIKEFKPYVSQIKLSLENPLNKTITLNQINEMVQI